MNNDLKKGIAGAILGAGILAGGGYNPADTDVVTGITYEEIQRNPERDVYYIVSVDNLQNNSVYFETSHQRSIDTLRKSLDGTRAVIKYDVGTVIRGVELGHPYTNEEMNTYLNNPENGFVNSDEIVKDEKGTQFAKDDNFIEP